MLMKSWNSLRRRETAKMAIVRTRRQINYTVLPNELLNDQNLEAAELGLLVYLLSKPIDWSVSIVGIASLKRFGSHGKVTSSLKRLRELGYASLERHSNGTTTWTITDTPATELTQQGEGMEPHSEFRNKDLEPYSENPHEGFRFDIQSNVEEQSTESLSRQPEKAESEPKEELPQGLNRATWEAFRAHRKEIRRALTRRSAALNIGIIQDIITAGLDPNEIIRQTIANGWTGLNWALDRNKGVKHGTDQDQRVDNSAPARVARAWEQKRRREAEDRQGTLSGDQGRIIDLQPRDYREAG